MKKYIKYALVVLFFFFLVGALYSLKPNPTMIANDSGWDSDYDSGGGFDSDWDSDYGGSSWDDDSSSSSSSSYGGSGKSFGEEGPEDFLGIELFLSIFFVIYFMTYIFSGEKGTFLPAFVLNIIRIVVMYLLELISPYFFLISAFGVFLFPLIADPIVKKRKKNRNNNRSYYKECSDEELNSAGIENRQQLKDELYKIFVDVQNAWMEFDYDSLSKLCSDELYNSYKSDLEVLKLKNGKNIMSDFNLLDMKILSASNKDNILTVKVLLQVKFHDYVINTISNEVIRGNKNNIMNNAYLLYYKKNNNIITKCPSCGGEIENSSNTKCPHCGNTIVNNNNNYVLTHKERI